MGEGGAEIRDPFLQQDGMLLKASGCPYHVRAEWFRTSALQVVLEEAICIRKPLQEAAIGIYGVMA